MYAIEINPLDPNLFTKFLINNSIIDILIEWIKMNNFNHINSKLALYVGWNLFVMVV